VIDLHCHILPGVDDGAATVEDSLEIARAAVGAGVHTIVATPHIRNDYPLDPAEIPARTDALGDELRAAEVDLRVLPGGEVALTSAPDLDDETLARLTLGGNGLYLLVESPYTPATDMLEAELFGLQVRGFRPILAHPERSPSFLADRARLAQLVERGMLCSITGASMTGRFGRRVRAFTVELFEAGLVHNVASDAHDAINRHPRLDSSFRSLDGELPGLADQAAWYTHAAPAAVLAGADLPERPQPPGRGGLRRRFRRRSRPGA
jgi:protein-tyrosine phosphatase